ncbi:MAG: serine hydrolase [Hyphomonadaceae bacterium]
MTCRTLLGAAAAVGAVGVAAAQIDGGEQTARSFMQGFPTADATRVGPSNWHMYPQVRWSVRHMRELFASRDATPAERRPAVLRIAPQPLDELRVAGESGDMSWQDFLTATHTDAAIVLHNGCVVFERYFDGMAPSDQHLLFSCTKSYCGLLAEILATRGQLDFSRPVESYLPEMANSAFADATVRQVADMTDGVHFSEDYTDPTADIYQHAYQMGLSPHDPANPPRGAYASAQTLTRRDHPSGHTFAYRSVATDVLGWIVQRAAAKSLSELYAEEIYTNIGADGAAYFTIDAASMEIASLGLNITLRDFARFGEMLRRGGRVGQRQAIPAIAVESITAGGDREAFARASMATRQGWSYKSQYWCTHDRFGSIWMLGVRGQRLLICPGLDLVMAKFGSHPIASNVATDAIHSAAIEALAQHFG